MGGGHALLFTRDIYKSISVIVIVASVSTILLAALTPLITRQAVNDAIAGERTRLPLLACGL
ncbi:hypothetical protein ONJ45_27060, partial [Salmonella enterica subsp. enterica serovar Virginia]|nr:hypothetical protein [Salmonella enterica subsp. enterica serovar Virginia]